MLGSVGAARAEPVPFAGTLQLRLGSLASFVTTGTGVGTLEGSADREHLNALRIGRNDIGGTATTPADGPFVVSLAGTFELAEGSLPALSGGPPVGTASGVQGRIRMCILRGPGCPSFVAIPLTANGTRGVGIGGQMTVSGFARAGIKISILGNPWTIATASVTGIPIDGGGVTTTSTFGFAHGPQSATSSTARPGGVLQLVTPAVVQTSFGDRSGLFGVLTIRFPPRSRPFFPTVFRPAALAVFLLLISSGLVALAVVARRRRVLRKS